MYVCMYVCMYVFYIFEYILYVGRVLTQYTYSGIIKSFFAFTNFLMPLPRFEPVAPNRPRLLGKHGMHSPNSLTICMYVCMYYVCMYVCMYEYVCVCLYVCMSCLF